MNLNLHVLKIYFEQFKKPELIIEFIYQNAYELIETTNELIKNTKELKNTNKFMYVDKDEKYIPKHTSFFMNIENPTNFDLSDLDKAYELYYKSIIQYSNKLWLHTIFPPTLGNYSNFYIGITGRITFFSVDKEDILDELYAMAKIKHTDRVSKLITWLEENPDIYIFNGNPSNWSLCGWLDEDTLTPCIYQFLVEENELEIRLNNFNPFNKKLLIYKNEVEGENNLKELEDQHKGNTESNYLIPTRRKYVSDQRELWNRIEKYKELVTQYQFNNQ